MERDDQQAGVTYVTAAVIAEYDNLGHAVAAACLDRYIDRLARSLASVINNNDPEVIVLGGGLGNIERLYREVPDRWGAYVFSDRVDTRLLKPVFGDSSGVRGAAWLW